MLTLLAPVLGLSTVSSAQGLWCYPQARLVLFSNYDGGRLTINVDEDIPDLHIGVVSYEFARIAITGPYAGNVAAVHYAGFNGDNDNCNSGGELTTAVLGVPASIVSINVEPPATLSDSFGYPLMTCGYSCAEGQYQGGCNTAQQVAQYFQTLWGLAPRFHRTQYGCWQGEWFISEGGNCCSGALSTAIGEAPAARPFDAQVTGQGLLVRDARGFRLLDGAGRQVAAAAPSAGPRVLLLNGLASGPYALVADDGMVQRFALER
ncbi:MAG: hypothetical protein ACK4L7_11245 [Flavobacteriales bacterium]